MHWAHRFEDNKTSDVVTDYYLFGSLNVWIQHSQQGWRTLSHVGKGLHRKRIGRGMEKDSHRKKDSVIITRIIKYKYQ